MNKVILKVGGMSCSACSNGLEKYLNKQKGIINANVNLVLSQVFVEYEDIITINDINIFIKEAGFESLGIYENVDEEKSNKKAKNTLIIFSILSIIILYISMGHMIGLPSIPILDMNKYPINYSIFLFVLTIIFLIYGMDIFKSGFKNLIHKMPNMDTLVLLGVLSSFLYSIVSMVMIILGHSNYVEKLYFESCSIVIYFIKLGRFIDLKSKSKTKEAIKELVQITPSSALLKTKNGEREVTIDEIKKSDILLAKPGMKIAVDGIIIKGSAHFDEAFITGESIPTKKSIGDSVVAGSINHDGYIEYEAKKIGKDSTISEIVRLVVESTNTKSKIARFADRVCSYFVPTIITIAFITFIGYLILGFDFGKAINSFVSILVVACPCALGLATPLAIVVSEGLCAKKGILVKTSEILENANKIDTIVFDKTGTLTYGNLKISKIFNYSDYSNDEIIKLVASIENKSTHPISKAFIDYINKTNSKLEEIAYFKNIAGIGLTAKIKDKNIYVGNNKLFEKLKIKNNYLEDETKLSNLGNSIVYVIENKKVIALIGVNDIVRKDSKIVISKLKKMGKNIIMLTGDNLNTAKIISKEIGIDNIKANVMPNEKAKVIKDLMSNNKNVMMVGDGINDAPCLATANIGVSVSSGTDIAFDSSDVILMNDDLNKIVELITISKKTLKNIKQNLFWAFFYNVCMIPIAIGGLNPFNIYINPMIAGISMMISSLTVVFNALRLKSIINKGKY